MSTRTIETDSVFKTDQEPALVLVKSEDSEGSGSLFEVEDDVGGILRFLVEATVKALAVCRMSSLSKRQPRSLKALIKAFLELNALLVEGSDALLREALLRAYPKTASGLLTSPRPPKEKKKSSDISKPTFTPPSREQVIHTMLSKGGDLELAKRFYAYYDSRGWRLANGLPMRSWEAAIARWVREEFKFQRERKDG